MMLEKGNFTTSKSIASLILNHTDRASGDVITHLKLQKLVYYVEAWFLANFDRPLFQEDAQAWTHGPVYRSIYDKYKGLQWDPLPAEKKQNLPDNLIEFVAEVYDEYGQFTAKKLEKMTHEEAPWLKTRGSLPLEARCEKPIDKLLTRNYYGKRIGKEEIKKLQD